MSSGEYKYQRIGEILIDSGMINQKQLEEALEIQKEKGGLIGSILVQFDYVSEDNLSFALAKQLNYPYLSLETITVNRNLVMEFGSEVLLEYLFIPIEKSKDMLTVAMADPSDDEKVKELEKKINCKILAFVSGVNQIEKWIRKVFDLPELNKKMLEIEAVKTEVLLKKATEEKAKKKKE